MTLNDLSKYKDSYLSEAREHVVSMNSALLKLEKEPQKIELVSVLFRDVHTLKSMAATMNYNNTARLCHAIEDVLDAVKKKRIKTQSCVDTLFRCFDILELSLREISNNREDPDTAALVEKLNSLNAIDESKITGKETFDDLENEAGDVKLPVMEKIKTIEVKVEKLDLLMNLTEELLINKMRLDRIKETIRHPELKAAVDIMERQVTEIQYNVMQARMVPVSFVFNRFLRLIRDLAKSQKKEIKLEMDGTDIELDRGVIDEIGESLVHLIKNAVDHGLETPDVRRESGKPPQGTIRLTARRNKRLVVIEVSDDGTGMDIGEIKKNALKLGVISEDATDEDIINSVFSGVSTTKHVTHVSGRGFGVNIVKEKIESIGGSIKIVNADMQAGKRRFSELNYSPISAGTKFVIEIPLTIAIIKSLFVNVSGRLYAVPVVNVTRLVTVSSEEIKGMLSYEAIIIDEEEIPLTRLDVLFRKTPSRHEKQHVAIVRKGEELLGLAVDSFMGTQEIVVKPLNRLLKENKYFAGSTIIGSGDVVLILDVNNLMLTKRTLTDTEGRQIDEG